MTSSPADTTLYCFYDGGDYVYVPLPDGGIGWWANG